MQPKSHRGTYFKPSKTIRKGLLGRKIQKQRQKARRRTKFGGKAPSLFQQGPDAQSGVFTGEARKPQRI
jgi:hypothetical protein